MALISCPECSHEVSENAASCPYCGFGVAADIERKERVEQERLDQERVRQEQIEQAQQAQIEENARRVKSRARKKKAIIGFASFVVVAALCCVALFVVTPLLKYQNAVKLMREGDYKNATIEFNKISDYRNSNELAEECVYNQAVNYMNAGEYDTAISIFTSLGNFSDSADKISECYYQQAMVYMKSEDYDEAIDILTSLDDYSDSVEKVNECNYAKAVGYMDSGDYATAINLFTSLGDYSDSIEKVNECNYAKAINYMKNEDYDNAIKLFTLLGKFSDSETMLSECKYRQATYLKSRGQYQPAADIYSMLGNYKDSPALYIECEYQHACGITNKSPLEALSFFENNPDYKDSADRIPECKYGVAINMYNAGELEKARDTFGELNDYNNSLAYITNIDILMPFQGTWTDGVLGIMDIIICGPQITDVFRLDGEVRVYTDNGKINGNYLQTDTNTNYDYIYKLDKNGNLIQGQIINKNGTLTISFDNNVSQTFVKKSDSTIKPAESRKDPPAIGMTAQQVRNSTWGSPDKINTTTTKYGTSEQWVYENNKYIYLEDGIVTAIQN